MRFRPSDGEEELSINLTPLIDVVFLLLIFFMVSTTFDTASHLEIQLPEAIPEELPRPHRQLNLIIETSGQYLLNGERLADQRAETLQLMLIEAMAPEPIPLVIQADALAPVQALVTAMDVVGRLGLAEVSIATTEPVE